MSNEAEHIKELMKNHWVWTKVKDIGGQIKEVRVDRVDIEQNKFTASYRDFKGTICIYSDLPIGNYEFYTS